VAVIFCRSIVSSPRSDDRWLDLARHANAMADKLAAALAAIGLQPVWPVEANLVFVVVPQALDAKLRAAGASYYVRNSDSLDTGADNVLIRLVTSFATVEEDVDRFVELCARSETRPKSAQGSPQFEAHLCGGAQCDGGGD
jgi:threonine aldolase